MHYVLFDNENQWKNFLPLTFTRPLSEIRFGILTIKQKWDKSLGTNCAYHTQTYLNQKFSNKQAPESIYINSTICPDTNLIKKILELEQGYGIVKNNTLLACRINGDFTTRLTTLNTSDYNNEVLSITNVWEIFQKNNEAIKKDFDLLTAGRKSQPLDNTVTVIGDPSLIFLENGAKAQACTINCTSGPVYLGTYAEIMEGSIVRGPLALCEHSALKLGAKLYGPTTIGPHSKVGGEVNNSVIFGYSNKAHDGFLGNSVIGEWCNLGADTNNSNLKNNYGNVKLYNYLQQKQIDTGQQFCGLIMGDYSKSGINTMFNTGTVVGVGCNIYGGGFPATHIPNFSWGGSEGFETYKLEKLFETNERVFRRRELVFGQHEKDILNSVFTSGF